MKWRSGIPLLALVLSAGVGFLIGGRTDLSEYDPAIGASSGEFSVDDRLIRSIIIAESGGDPSAVSSRGAIGLMQLLPETAEELSARLGLGEVDPFDPVVNIRLGTYHLSLLLTSFEGRKPFAVAAYNAGAARVREWARRAPHLRSMEVVDRLAYDETRQYVHRVLEGVAADR